MRLEDFDFEALAAEARADEAKRWGGSDEPKSCGEAFDRGYAYGLTLRDAVAIGVRILPYPAPVEWADDYRDAAKDGCESGMFGR